MDEGWECPHTFTYHWSLSISKHMAPVTELMLGCQIFVINRTWKKELNQSDKFSFVE